MTATPITPTRVEGDTAYAEVPHILDALVAPRIAVKHGLGTHSPHLRAYTSDGIARGVAYLHVVDEDTVEATVSDDTAYVEVSR